MPTKSKSKSKPTSKPKRKSGLFLKFLLILIFVCAGCSLFGQFAKQTPQLSTTPEPPRIVTAALTSVPLTPTDEPTFVPIELTHTTDTPEAVSTNAPRPSTARPSTTVPTNPPAANAQAARAQPTSAPATNVPPTAAANTSYTAECVDGTISNSQHASGTCSGHKGVLRWINHPSK